MSVARPLRSLFGAPHQLVSWSALVGYDLFISYRRSDATRYAAGLFKLLRQADFRCFLDDNDATPGQPLTDKLRRALKRSKVLLIVASPELPLSVWVPKEVEIFAKSRRDIILINVKDGMAAALQSNTLGPLLDKDKLWIDELSGMGLDDAPSPHVIGSVQKNFNHRRANRNLRVIAGAVTIAIAGFAMLAGWQWRTAVARLDVVQSQALAADARRLASQEPLVALRTALAAFATSDSPDAETALLEGLSRVPRLRRFLPCAEGQKAVGAAFSGAGDGLLGYACLSYGKSGPHTALRVVDLEGVQKYRAIVDGDARSFSFADGLHLLVELPGRIATLELQTGQLLASSSQPAPPSRIARPGEVQAVLNEAAADCVRKHPYSTRYFTSAVSADGRLTAYTTEANQIVIADLTNGHCAGHPLDAHTHNILSIAWGPTGRYLASSGAIADGDNSHGVALWDRKQISSFAHIIYELKNPDPKIALSGDGSSWLCGSCDDRIVWDGRPVDLPPGVDAGQASAAAMSPDGKEAAVAVPGKIIVIRRSATGFNVELRESPSAPVHAIAYVNGSLYAEDEKLSAWNVSGRGAVKTATAAPFDSTRCFDGSPAGPYFTSEVFDRAGTARLTLTDLNSGVVKEFPLPSDVDTCATLTFSPEAMIAVRTSANYRPFLALSVDSGSPVRRISNPLRQSAGLPTVLRSAHLSRDGRRLVASSDNSGLAVFNLAADRLIGAIDLSEVQHVALAASGKVALVEGAGRILSVDLDSASWQRKAQQLVSQ